MKKLYLVDASNMFFRAYYAIRPLTNSKGLPTNALYGYLSMTVKLLREVKPDYLAYCYDSKEDGFREELYPEYKANRSDPPEDLIPQFPYFQKLSEVLGIPSFQMPGVEADDIIGTLTEFGKNNNLEIYIVSGDKDFAQLIGPMVKMTDTMKDITYGVDGVREKWGVRPDQIVDYLSLVGDASDNIPGVEGVGQKTAQKLLTEYDSLDNIYENIDKVKPDKLREKIIRCKEMAYLSKKLVTIERNLSLPLSLESLKPKPLVRDEVIKLLTELEFKTFERKILGGPVETPSPSLTLVPQVLVPTTQVDEINVDNQNSEGADKSLDKNSEGRLFNRSSKTSSEISPETLTENISKIPERTLDKVSDENSGRNSEGNSYSSPNENSLPVVPVAVLRARTTAPVRDVTGHDLSRILQEGQELWVLPDERSLIFSDEKEIFIARDDLKNITEVLDQKNIKWKGFDLKSFWRSLNLKRVRIAYDHKIASYVISAGNIGTFNEVYDKTLLVKVPDFPEPEELLNANLDLEAHLISKLENQNGLDIFYKFDLPLVPVLHAIEQEGFLIDTKILSKMSLELATDIRALEKSIHENAGESFNVASPKQLARILFDKLKLTPSRKTKTGFSTDSDVLEKLEKEHPIARLLIDYRELSKLKSTYVDSLPLLVNPIDLRIHSILHQTVTTTGRLSSTHPNLQNIPIRTERGNAIRKAFIAPPGCSIISADYSQIELRILAHVTGDPGLIKAFENDLDIHAATASEVFGVDLKEVTPDLRRIAKAVNFGLAYGMGPHGLAENLGISRTEASEIIKKYFIKFSRVKEYMTEIVELAKRQGYVETTFGRRRYFPDLQSKAPALRAFGERAAINAPMQGTAADIVKKAMIELYNTSKAKMILQVHDELIFEVKTEDVSKYKKDIKEVMEGVVNLRVPLRVNIAEGPSWFEAH